ncbi:hypothetical protein BS47DRAFT_1367351 [Hydnum rufescens UP504]|uniref:Uncharacterized protein n=1 Tax=Hydnum rufescens UP504 TaxID=1448309 RepID=A0A9P6DQA7_9AGAM|nr:hypothetical protein BS47DRAFT_1367351 [Hydnum rufescens UP504]
MRSSVRELLGAEGKYDVATIVSPGDQDMPRTNSNSGHRRASIANVSSYWLHANVQQRQEQDREAMRISEEWAARRNAIMVAGWQAVYGCLPLCANMQSHRRPSRDWQSWLAEYGTRIEEGESL